MGMTLKANFGNSLKNDIHLTLVVNVIRKDILVHWIPGGTMNKKVRIFPVHFGPFGKKIPTLLTAHWGLVRLLQLIPGPKNCLLSSWVKPLRVKNRCIIMITEQNQVKVANQVHAFPGIGSISNHITKTITLGYPLRSNVLKNRRKRFQIAMDITYYCLHGQVPGLIPDFWANRISPY